MRGLAVLLPSILTLWILWYAFFFVFDNVAAPINGWIRTGIIQVVPHALNEPYQPQWYEVSPDQIRVYRRDNPAASSIDTVSDEAVAAELRARAFAAYWRARWHLQAVGLLVAIVAIYLAGGLLGGFLGRRMYGRVERIITRIPVFRQIYPHVKQVVELILGDSPMAFTRVVMVEFPRKGMWVLGFVTGDAMRALAAGVGRPALTVFIPNTPTPFTGFTVTVPVDEVIDVPVSIDEALRYLITGGVLMPGSPPDVEAPRDSAAALPGTTAAGVPRGP